MSAPSSYADVFAGLDAVEQVAAAACGTAGLVVPRVYAIRPTRLEAPAIYNVMDPGVMDPQDTVADRDTLFINARIAIRHGDADEEFDQLLALADVVRTTFDRALKDQDNPLGTRQARRVGVRLVEDTFGELTYRAFEFPIRVYLDVLNAPAYP